MKDQVSSSNFDNMKVQGWCIALSYLWLPFSPLLSFYFSIITLVILSGKIVRYSLYPLIVVSFSIIIISRNLFITHKDDFETYYYDFISILEGGDLYRFGFEIGLPSINYIIGLLIGWVSPRGLLFIYAVLQLLLLVIFIEIFITRYNLKNKSNQFTAIVFATLPALALTLYVRQGFTVMLLGIVFLTKEKIQKFILLILASFFHLTAIPIYVIFKVLPLFTKMKWLSLLVLSIIIWFVAFTIVVYIEQLPKIRGFTLFEGIEFNALIYIFYYKYIILAFFLSLPLRGEVGAEFRKAVFLVLSLAFVMDNTLPYISFRVFLITVIFPGVALFFVYSKYKYPFNQFGFFWVILSIMFLLKFVSLLTGSGEFSVFQAYPATDYNAFYYFDELFEEVNMRKRDY